MTIGLLILVSLVMFFAGALSIFVILSSHHRLEKRLSILEQAEEQRRKLLTDVRGRERTHHAYNTLAAIEDATALLIDAELDLEAMRARQETALGILRILRRGPYEYKSKETTNHD